MKKQLASCVSRERVEAICKQLGFVCEAILDKYGGGEILFSGEPAIKRAMSVRVQGNGHCCLDRIYVLLAGKKISSSVSVKFLIRKIQNVLIYLDIERNVKECCAHCGKQKSKACANRMTPSIF